MGLFEQLAAGSSKMVNSSSETVNILEHATNAFPSISIDHSRIHQGKFFEASIQKASLSAGGTYNISFTTPVSGYMHYRQAQITCSADNLTADFYEGNTISGGATATAFNRNRNNTAAATLSIVTSANITADGTLIQKTFIGGGSGISSTRSGGSLSQENEWVLDQNKNYNLRLTNGGTGANTVNVNLVWYESDAT
jgi:hypothetical protein